MLNEFALGISMWYVGDWVFCKKGDVGYSVAARLNALYVDYCAKGKKPKDAERLALCEILTEVQNAKSNPS